MMSRLRRILFRSMRAPRFRLSWAAWRTRPHLLACPSSKCRMRRRQSFAPDAWKNPLAGTPGKSGRSQISTCRKLGRVPHRRELRCACSAAAWEISRRVFPAYRDFAPVKRSFYFSNQLRAEIFPSSAGSKARSGFTAMLPRVWKTSRKTPRCLRRLIQTTASSKQRGSATSQSRYFERGWMRRSAGRSDGNNET